ncbi:MAG: HutD family protein [Burkholderiaceae bacterium]
MTPRRIDASAVAPQPWRNGGGSTRELLAWPDAQAWSVRISLAEIEADGPFSDFADVQRWFAVVEGAGVALRFGAIERRVTPSDAPLRFDGSHGPHCALVDGPTSDLNLMLHGAHGVMQRVEPGVSWVADFRFKAIYTAVAGIWRGDAAECELPAGTLLWSDAPGHAFEWVFDAAEHAGMAAWWLGATAPTVAR